MLERCYLSYPRYSSFINEDLVEDAILTWLAELGYRVHSETYGGGRSFLPERESWREVAFPEMLRELLTRINPGCSVGAIDEAIQQVRNAGGRLLIQANRAFHGLLTNGVAVDVPHNGEMWGERVELIDFGHSARNDLRAINRFTVIEGKKCRRSDVVIFVNSMPQKNLAVELLERMLNDEIVSRQRTRIAQEQLFPTG